MDREFCVFLPPVFYIVFLPFLFPALSINLLFNFVLQPWMNVHCHSLQIHLLYQMYQPFNPNVILLSWNGEGDSDLGDKFRIVEGFSDDEGIQGLDSLSLTSLSNTLT